MPFEEIGLVLQIITVGILVIGVFFGVRQLQGISTQLKLNVFTTYTSRYSKIIGQLPNEANDPKISILDNLSPSSKDSIIGIIRQFFDLCSEEFYLSQRKLVDKKVWNLWTAGMKFHMKCKSFQNGWSLIKKEGYDSEFVKFIEKMIPA